jgi:hypothetical protein
VDFHRPDALRILDFPHAGEHVAQIGQGVFGEGTLETEAWLAGQLHQLKHEGPGPLLAEAGRLMEAHPDLTSLAEPVAYLVKREAHMQYPAFQAAGWPIGDGAVESGNKLVVEARLKGSGMHWARPHVDPLLALRNIACNDRWEEAWPQITHELRRQTRQRRAERHQRRRAPADAQRLRPSPEPEPSRVVMPQLTQTLTTLAVPEPTPKSPLDQPKERWKPAANHPWRQPFLLKTKRQLAQSKHP